jgi:signal transduction histidine kinase
VKEPLPDHTTTCDLSDLGGRLTQQTAPLAEWQQKNDLSGAQGNETLLTQVLGQLLANAVKFSPEGKRIEFSGERVGSDAVFRVTDQGIGIPQEDMPKLFTPFGRASNAAAIPGSGLGLLIVKRCLEQQGGSIEVDSTLGRGTTFTVRLPLFLAGA